MPNSLRFTIVLTAVAWAIAPGARAQFPYNPTYDYYPRAVYYPMGYQFYGWSGWGLPVQVQGQIARGMGIYAQGVSQAQARASQANRDEMTRRWNTFFWSAQHVANLARIAHRLPRDARDQADMEATLARIRDRPTAEEIERGVALNALLDQLTDPRIPPAAFRSSRTPLSPKLIQQVPYEYASEVITFLLERLTDDDRWPAFLAGQRFAEPRRALRSTLETAVEEDRAGELSKGTVRRVNLAVQGLAATAGANLPKTSPSYPAAEAYLKELTGLARMLGRPNVDEVLAALDRRPAATVEDLLAFLQMFNLRFGEATTPAQRSAYQALYPILARWHGGLARQLGGRLPQGGLPLKGQAAPALTIFSAMTWDQLTGVPAK